MGDTCHSPPTANRAQHMTNKCTYTHTSEGSLARKQGDSCAPSWSASCQTIVLLPYPSSTSSQLIIRVRVFFLQAALLDPLHDAFVLTF